MRKGELYPRFKQRGLNSFRDADISVRQNRNRQFKRLHRFADHSGYWYRYGHSGYPMQQIMRIQKFFQRVYYPQSAPHCEEQL